jgi:hypothetical protein
MTVIFTLGRADILRGETFQEVFVQKMYVLIIVRQFRYDPHPHVGCRRVLLRPWD